MDAGCSDPVEASCPCLTALGQRLRQARQDQALPAGVLADRLRIGVEQLEALESADRERLPEAVFVIAQARRVAGALQLDITAELQALRASGELGPRPRPGTLRLPRAGPVTPGAATSSAAAPAGTRAPQRWPALMPNLLAAVALLLALAGFWGLWRLRGSAPGGRPPMPPRAGEAVGVLHDSPPTAPPPASSAAPSAPAASGVVAAGMLVLASREPSWVEVRRPDGAILFRGLLRGSRLFALGQGLEVLAARPDLVTSRVAAAAAKPLGLISEVRWRSLPAAR